MKKPPVLSPAIRRLNERLVPDILKAYDEQAQRLAQAVAARRRGDALRAADAIETLQRRIIRPVPVWRRPGLAAMAAVLVLGSAVVTVAMPRSRYTVTVMSPGGDALVREVLHEVTPITGLMTTVSESGVLWEGLRPGNYVVKMQGGTERKFSVPDEPVILLPGRQDNLATLVAAELGLQAGAASEEQGKP
jgi:hypothetical protein